MALIEYNIDMDEQGNTVIVPRILRLDTSDEVHLITKTPNAALQWNRNSPFLAPAADKVVMLRQTTMPQQPLHPAGPIDLSQALALCGESDGKGSFIAWPQSGGGFPDVSKGASD